MYLHNSSIREERAKFVYSLEWDDENFAFVFHISETVAHFFKSNINPQNSISRLIEEKLGIVDFELDIFKSYGCPHTSENLGVKDGMLKISFPIGKGVTILDSSCDFCHGSGITRDQTCYSCHGTKKEIQRNVNVKRSTVSIYSLLSHLNFFVCFPEFQEQLFETKDFQHLYLEIVIPLESGRGYALGSNISQELRDGIATLSEEDIQEISQTMYQCSLAMDGFIQHPEWERRNQEYEFRCLIKEEGFFYLEVPGVNSCSFYLSRQGGIGPNALSCHNIDSAQQATLLLVGFAKMCSLVAKKQL